MNRFVPVRSCTIKFVAQNLIKMRVKETAHADLESVVLFFGKIKKGLHFVGYSPKCDVCLSSFLFSIFGFKMQNILHKNPRGRSFRWDIGNWVRAVVKCSTAVLLCAKAVTTGNFFAGWWPSRTIYAKLKILARKFTLVEYSLEKALVSLDNNYMAGHMLNAAWISPIHCQVSI